MYNKFNTPKYQYHHHHPYPPSIGETLERQNYNRVLLRLNEENEYLSHNMKQLIQQNLALKNKLYHQTDSTYRAKDYAKYDVEEQVRRTEHLNKQTNYQHNKRLKTQQSRGRPQSWKMPANRQSHQQSVLKKPTIIEGLSDSQFENHGEKSRMKNSQGKKGILLSKQVEKRQIQKRSHQQSQKFEQQEEVQLQQIQSRQLEEQIERSKKQQKPKEQQEEKNNPQKQQSKVSKHKKDNSPYLKGANPYVGTPSRLSTFNNSTYLNYSAK